MKRILAFSFLVLGKVSAQRAAQLRQGVLAPEYEALGFFDGKIFEFQKFQVQISGLGLDRCPF